MEGSEDRGCAARCSSSRVRLAPGPRRELGAAGSPANAHWTLIEVMQRNSNDLPLSSLIPVLVFVMRWDIAARELARRFSPPSGPSDDGRLGSRYRIERQERPGPPEPVTVAVVGEYWGDSRRTMYRQQSRFRSVFPEERDPARLLELCRGWDRRLGWRGLANAKVYVVE